MQEALVSELVKQIQPALYFIGVLTLVVLVVFGGGILKIIVDAKKEQKKQEKEKEQKVDISLEGLKNAVIENTKSIYKLEVKFDVIADRHEKDLNALGNKIREVSP